MTPADLGDDNAAQARVAAWLARLFPASWINAIAEAKGRRLFVPNPNCPDNDLEHSRNVNFAQEMQFAIDALPELDRVLRGYPRGEVVRLLDYGPGFGAGASLLAQLHRSPYLSGCSLQVDALDMKPFRKPLADLLFPEIHYRTGELAAFPADHWPVVYCSNVIEHTTEPQALLQTLIDKARDWVLVLAPYRENPLSAGHASMIDEAVFEPFHPVVLRTFVSRAWHPLKGERQILALIDKRRLRPNSPVND